MKRLLLIGIATLCLNAGQALTAQHKIDVSISPYLGKGFGHTKWVMEQRSVYDLGVYMTIKSELEYPLNALYGGLNLRIGSGPAASRDWSVALSVGTNLNDPTNKMKDHDWMAITDYMDEKISYTESRAEMNSLVGSVEGQLTLAQGRLVRFGVIGGVRYQHFDQELYDLSGWYLDTAFERVYYEEYQDTLVGKYKITYTMPNLGFFCRFQFSPVASAELQGAFALPFVSDEDDHVLRYRIATASGSGTGFLGKVRLRFAPAMTGKRIRPFVELDGELLTVDAKPKQEIYWYGDDPITPDPDEDETGLRVPNIPHHITSKQGYITGRIGLSF